MLGRKGSCKLMGVNCWQLPELQQGGCPATADLQDPLQALAAPVSLPPHPCCHGCPWARGHRDVGWIPAGHMFLGTRQHAHGRQGYAVPAHACTREAQVGSHTNLFLMSWLCFHRASSSLCAMHHLAGGQGKSPWGKSLENGEARCGSQGLCRHVCTEPSSREWQCLSQGSEHTQPPEPCPVGFIFTGGLRSHMSPLALFSTIVVLGPSAQAK